MISAKGTDIFQYGNDGRVDTLSFVGEFVMGGKKVVYSGKQKTVFDNDSTKILYVSAADGGWDLRSATAEHSDGSIGVRDRKPGGKVLSRIIRPMPDGGLHESQRLLDADGRFDSELVIRTFVGRDTLRRSELYRKNGNGDLVFCSDSVRMADGVLIRTKWNYDNNDVSRDVVGKTVTLTHGDLTQTTKYGPKASGFVPTERTELRASRSHREEVVLEWKAGKWMPTMKTVMNDKRSLGWVFDGFFMSERLFFEEDVYLMQNDEWTLAKTSRVVGTPDGGHEKYSYAIVSGEKLKTGTWKVYTRDARIFGIPVPDSRCHAFIVTDYSIVNGKSLASKTFAYLDDAKYVLCGKEWQKVESDGDANAKRR